jgi:lysyl-tRNA synthetase class I
MEDLRLIEKLKALRLYFVRKRPIHNIKVDSIQLLDLCDNYMIRYRAKLPIGAVEKINELSYHLEELSKDVC